MPAHTHDHIDWAARIPDLRQQDKLNAGAFAAIAARLTAALPAGATVVDVGSGAGGMSAALASALASRGGGTLLLVDAVPELLAAAAETAAAVLANAGEHGVDAGAGGVDAAARGVDVGGGSAVGASRADVTERSAGGANAERTVGGTVANGTAGGAVTERSAGGAVAEQTAGAVNPARAAGPVAGEMPTVKIDTVRADVAAHPLGELVPAADLVWAASMIHHLPDQQAGVTGLASALSPSGVLAVAEGGLETQTLPWDLGIGEPGLERRLMAARDDWFGEMRASMEGAVGMPYGWTTALARAGLVGAGSFTALIDHARTTDVVREFVLGRLARMAETVDDRIGDEDREALRRLLDPNSADYLGHRDDLYVLGTRTVHFGRKR